MQEEIQKAFCFWDNCVRIGCVKLSLLRREYLSSAVNVLTNSYKALRLTKTDLFKCDYLEIKINFLNFLLYFRNIHKIWNTFGKKMSLRRNFFLSL